MGEVEKWKQINGFPRYEISNFGNLNSVKDKGFQPSCVCNCCKGNRNIKQHKGYVFRYATKEEIGDYKHEETN